MRPLNDEELTKVLSEWRPPLAPASVEARVRGEQGLRWWQWMVRGRIHVPVPLAAMALLALLLWGAIGFDQGSTGERQPVQGLAGFEVVADLNPRIIRGTYEDN